MLASDFVSHSIVFRSAVEHVAVVFLLGVGGGGGSDPRDSHKQIVVWSMLQALHLPQKL